jgi:uncharacterized repeat protein (TIGR03803 family)
MKTHIKKLFFLPALIVALDLTLTGRATAQTFTNLHRFTGSDGSGPNTVILSGNTLYATTFHGGRSNNGTVFAVNTDGSGYTNLYNFTGGKDGGDPRSVLILSGSTLYGTAQSDGSKGGGTVFAISTNSIGFTNLYNFTGGNDGAYPEAGVILFGDTLYGTASQGGSGFSGTVFSVNTNGMDITPIYGFNDANDGGTPVAGVILSGNTLYGTAYAGGSAGGGTVFRVNTDSTDFTNLHSFASIPNDGYWPEAGLVLSGNTLYGTASAGGSAGKGTVFAVNTDGSNYTNLYNFTGGNDGAEPAAGLILSGSTLYGTASEGGSSGVGTVFAVNTNGTGFINLHTFTNSPDGANPHSGLILSGNTLYGTASDGGSSGNGTVFSISLVSVSAPPRLTIISSGTNVILTWPANATGFTLQSTTNLTAPAVWIPVTGQFKVTNSIFGTQKFYRLSQ